MRWIRNFSVVIFLLAVAVFGGYKLYHRATADPSGPQITMEQDVLRVSVRAGEAALMKGITAEDEKDGDLTDQIILESLSDFLEPGVRTMQVAVVDSDGHVTKATREIHYTDYEPPQFELTGPLRVPLNSENLLANVKVTDVLDGDLSNSIKILTDEVIYTGSEGEYPVEFSVTNSAGDTARLKATLTVYSSRTQPGSFGLSEYLVYATARDEIVPWDYVQTLTTSQGQYSKDSSGALRWTDKSTGLIYTIDESRVKITNEVDYSEPGDYEITYRYVDTQGYVSEGRLIVVVPD